MSDRREEGERSDRCDRSRTESLTKRPKPPEAMINAPG